MTINTASLTNQNSSYDIYLYLLTIWTKAVYCPHCQFTYTWVKMFTFLSEQNNEIWVLIKLHLFFFSNKRWVHYHAVYPGFFYVSQNFQKMGKICSIFNLHQSILAILKVSYRKYNVIQDVISAYSIYCDMKEIPKKAKIRSSQKLPDLR